MAIRAAQHQSCHHKQVKQQRQTKKKKANARQFRGGWLCLGWRIAITTSGEPLNKKTPANLLAHFASHARKWKKKRGGGWVLLAPHLDRVRLQQQWVRVAKAEVEWRKVGTHTNPLILTALHVHHWPACTLSGCLQQSTPQSVNKEERGRERKAEEEEE